MWRSIHEFEIQDLSFNTVLLIFSTKANAIKFYHSSHGPLTSTSSIFYKPTKDEYVDGATFDTASFWIQIHNLPISGMNKANAEAIG